MEVILLERVDNLGGLGEVVRVKPGFARNYLLPQKKALRATKDNLAYFETQRAALEKVNAENMKEAQKLAKKVEGAKVVLIRLASEGGQLFGGVNAKDIAEALSEQSGVAVTRGMVYLNLSLKTLGLFEVPVSLHPEVKVKITINIARSAEEAKIQAKTGKAVIVDPNADTKAEASDSKASLLEEGALAAETQESATSEAETAEEAAVRAEKSAKRQAKKKAKASDETAESAE